MKIYLGADHGGFSLKEEVKKWLVEEHYEVEDCGATTLNPEDDYPDFSFAVAEKVAANKGGDDKGIIFCRSGAGAIIAANKIPGIRAVNTLSLETVQHAREDNNANVIGIGADILNAWQAKENILAFLTTPFSNEERHVRRLQKIAEREPQQ